MLGFSTTENAEIFNGKCWLFRFNETVCFPQQGQNMLHPHHTHAPQSKESDTETETERNTRYQDAFRIPRCIPNTKMHSEYQDAFRIPRCIPNTKMHSEYQDAFRIPRCIPNTKMHSLFERIANGDPHPKHPSFRLSMPLGLGKQKENKSIVNPNV
eukprot:Selendium_serpulae@DN5290_c1_g1_i1.p2